MDIKCQETIYLTVIGKLHINRLFIISNQPDVVFLESKHQILSPTWFGRMWMYVVPAIQLT